MSGDIDNRTPGQVLFEAILKQYPLWAMVKYSELSKATQKHWDEFELASHEAVERQRVPQPSLPGEGERRASRARHRGS